MKLFLIRHPKPDVPQGLCYGDMDVPLLDGWESAAQQLKNTLSKSFSVNSVAYYHSPLVRAAKLAEFISDGHSEPVEALKELDFGDWEGLCWKDIPREQIDLWANDIVNSAPYHGESLQAVAERVWPWWLSVKDSGLDACVLVAHSGVIKVLVSLLCQWPLSQCHRIDVGFTSLTELSVQGEFISLKRLGAGDWVAA